MLNLLKNLVSKKCVTSGWNDFGQDNLNLNFCLEHEMMIHLICSVFVMLTIFLCLEAYIGYTSCSHVIVQLFYFLVIGISIATELEP